MNLKHSICLACTTLIITDILRSTASPAQALDITGLFAAQTATFYDISIPVWARQRSTDSLLDFSAADAAQLAVEQQEGQHVDYRGQQLNATLKQGYYYGNVAAVRFGSELYVAVRKIQFYFTLRTQVEGYPLELDPSKKFISWWKSKISLCKADAASLQPTSCSDFDPRSWKQEECIWNAGFESLGPEDPRFIVWPGKGLYVMFVSKPWPVQPGGRGPANTHCEGPWAQQPWLMPLVTFAGTAARSSSSSSDAGSSNSGGSSSISMKPLDPGGGVGRSAAADPWLAARLIRLQYLPNDDSSSQPEEGLSSSSSSDSGSSRHNYRFRSKHHLHKEKNWNPFIYRNELYFSQSFEPHVVIKPFPNGTCVKVYSTSSTVLQALPSTPKGNTPAVLLPAAVTGAQQDLFIGVVHTEVARSYTNYFYLMQAAPPFPITALSRPIPLQPGTHPRVPSWTHISFPVSLQLLEETQQLMIGYGSGDQAARILVMGLEQALALFDKGWQQQWLP